MNFLMNAGSGVEVRTRNLAYILLYFVVTVLPGWLAGTNLLWMVIFSLVYFAVYNVAWCVFLAWVFLRRLPNVLSLGFLLRVLGNLGNPRLLLDELLKVDLGKLVRESFRCAAWVLLVLPVAVSVAFYFFCAGGNAWVVVSCASGYWVAGAAGFWLARDRRIAPMFWARWFRGFSV
jgi:hypothetical protein